MVLITKKEYIQWRF